MADGREQQEVGDSHWEGGGVITQKLTRTFGSHFHSFSFCLPFLVGAGGGSGRRSRDPEVEEKSWISAASDARPLLQACPIGPQPGEKCPLTLLLRPGDLLPSPPPPSSRGSTRRARNALERQQPPVGGNHRQTKSGQAESNRYRFAAPRNTKSSLFSSKNLLFVLFSDSLGLKHIGSLSSLFSIEDVDKCDCWYEIGGY